MSSPFTYQDNTAHLPPSIDTTSTHNASTQPSLRNEQTQSQHQEISLTNTQLPSHSNTDRAPTQPSLLNEHALSSQPQPSFTTTQLPLHTNMHNDTNQSPTNHQQNATHVITQMTSIDESQSIPHRTALNAANATDIHHDKDNKSLTIQYNDN
eukprot:133498_1